MSRIPVRLVAIATLAAATSATAIDFGFGLLKRRQNPSAKADSPQGIKQLITTLQSDPDVDHRKSAVEELKTVDTRGNADVLAALVGSLHKDPSPVVRSAIAEAFGTSKAASAKSAAILGEVEKSDPDASVRAAAKAALWRYQLETQKLAGSSASPVNEPPFARPPVPGKPVAVTPALPPATSLRPITQGPGRGGIYRETPEPPFATPKPMPAPEPKPLAPLAPVVAAPPLPMPAQTTKPGELPPLSIPAAPPVIVAPPPGTGTGLPTIVPPGGGR